MPLSLPTEIENLGRALSCRELAQLLNIHRATAFRLAVTGRIPAFRIGHSIRFDCRVVASYLRHNGEAR